MYHAFYTDLFTKQTLHVPKYKQHMLVSPLHDSACQKCHYQTA